MRNRRVRLLVLAIFISISFFLYSRSDPATIDQAKRLAEKTYHDAERKYHQAIDQTLGKQKEKSPEVKTSQSDAVNAALEEKKDEPFRVDFGAYSKAAGLMAEETTPAAIPPPAAPVPKEPKKDATKEKDLDAALLEPKKDDPMRVDFDHYSKVAQLSSETPAAVAGGSADVINNPVVANPNPIAVVAGQKEKPVKDDEKPAKVEEKPAKAEEKPVKAEEKPVKAATTPKPEAKINDKSSKPRGGLVQQDDKADPLDFDNEIGKGRVELDASATAQPVHWTRLVEQYPITSTNPYPYTDGKVPPKIQHNFKSDPTAGGADKAKLDEIKAAAVHSWKGYRDQAMGHDEVKPISGKYADPFNGYGATLVDALDTLWLMGMKEEFEEALGYVKKIDFTTSRRPDIPLFETTIRYLGGLLGAYEISGRNYDILYNQIKQLGEILYGAFDTPNRMPMTYYRWKPDASDKAHRASRKTIMAELGSLSLEFTRLGQIVGEPKYYDAIARITYELGQWQDNTRIPGLWPTTLDASGCARTEGEEDDSEGRKGPAKATPPKIKAVEEEPVSKPKTETSTADSIIADTGITAGSPDRKLPGIGKIANFGNPLTEGDLDSPSAKDSLFNKGAAAVKEVFKRAVDTIGFSKDDVANIAAAPEETMAQSSSTKDTIDKVASSKPRTCVPQGLTETDPLGSDVFTLGAAADSTYEYLPKMYMLLGGRSDEYRKMYIKAADAAMEHLIYRPMIPDEKREILFAGNVDSKPKASNPKVINNDFKAVATHLTCFVGGMFGMAGKIFNRPDDIEMARKLTDGCIWAYNATATGIMPEIMGLVKCDSTEKCKWDTTKYYQELDPFAEQRLSSKDTTKTRDDRALEKRQYGGGEMQYGIQTAPAVLPAAAASIVAEVPPLGMGVAGMPNQKPADDTPAIKMPYDAGAARKLPGVEDPKQDDLKPMGKIENKNDFSLETKDSGPPAVKEKPAVDRLAVEKSAAEEPAVEKPAAEKSTKTKADSGDTPLSHEEYVKKKIADERLPTGFVGMYDKKYELRPEAIESVFYMYRITGEEYWRERGWEMWTAVQKHTKATYGATAIDDVSKKSPVGKDREESFWLAETLKYFYLLFDDPDRISLDDWVLNTEAHFLTRLGS